MEFKVFIVSARAQVKRIAKDLNVSAAHLSNIANKKAKPSERLAEQIVAYTKGIVTMEDLMNGFEKRDYLREFIDAHAVA